MDAQGVGKKEGLDCTGGTDKGLEEGLKILQRRTDEYTMDVGKDPTMVLEDSVDMGEDLICEGLDQFPDEVLESSNDVRKVPDFSMNVAKVKAVVVEGGSNKEKFQGKVLGDGVDVDKVEDEILDGGMEANKVEDKVLKGGVEVDKCLEAGVVMDKVEGKVLESSMGADKFGRAEVEKFQDKVLEYDVDLNTPENNFPKENVNGDKVHDPVLDDSMCLSKVIDVSKEAVDMNKVQNGMEDCINVDETPNEVLKTSVDVDKNGLNLKKVHDEVFEGLNVEDALNAQELMETMRCQVRITTRHNLQLCMANHTAQDVYVRLLSHGERITGSGLQALKNPVHLSPTKPSTMPENPELEVPRCESQETGQEESSVSGPGQEEERNKEELEEENEDDGCHAISDTAYSPCSSVMPTPVEETQGGVDFLFQSPGRLLRELHANPEIQAELWAEQQRELIREGARQSLCGQSDGTPQIRAFLHSAARLVAVASILLFLLLVLLLVLLESDLDVSFLQDIRETPEFEQFHYEYYCPLRRWLCYKVEHLKEHLWGD